ncbi:hypothetical protein evm_014567 [Chilo suppressalis]|nr:hypothetical protein evm_014567 [Chilo suppressalis]
MWKKACRSSHPHFVGLTPIPYPAEAWNLTRQQKHNTTKSQCYFTVFCKVKIASPDVHSNWREKLECSTTPKVSVILLTSVR